MVYRRRIQLAGACSFALHAAAVALGAYLMEDGGGAAPTHSEEPLVISLKPERQQAPRRLIETDAATDAPDNPTDLISDKNSRAQDLSDMEGERPQPHFEEPSEFDALARAEPAAAFPPLVLPPGTDAAPVEKAKKAIAPLQEAPAAVVKEREALRAPADPEASQSAETDPEPEVLEPLADSPAEPFDVAQAPALPLPEAPPGEARGRVDGGIKSKGFTNFEANEHALGPYMLEIRRRVEREWRAALQLRYSGATPTEAVLECAINPMGQVVEVNIVSPGNSISYAPLCKDAIERAGPFPAFPFEVPEMYRSKNLEIRWKFSYM